MRSLLMNAMKLKKKRISLIILLVIISLIPFVIISGCMDTFNPRLFTSSYEYNLQIRTDSPLYNVTFIVPLPVKNDEPMIGNKTFSQDDFQQPDVSATLTQSPPGLNLTGAVPLSGYQPWFIVIKTDKFAPVNGSSLVYSVKMNNEHFYTELTDFQVVPNPASTGSLLVPKFNFTWKEPVVKNSDSYLIRYLPLTTPEDTIIFADYQTTPTTHVTISSSYSVENSWREAYDDTYMNSYRDIFSVQFTGNRNAWSTMPGSIQSDSDVWDGWYPNTTNPEWQQVLTHPLANPYIPPYST